MKTINDLPDGVNVEVTDHGYRTDFALSSSYEKDRYHKPYGNISIEELEEVGVCGNAWAIAMVSADHGWGPFMYDIAIEWATMNHGGLISDRAEVSADARGVWSYYLNNRPDVTAHQLDNRRNTLTPEPEDNCDQSIADDIGVYSWTDNEESIDDADWVDSPLSKRYTKAPTTINALKAAGKWDER